MAFKDLATSDFVVGQVWGAVKADRFLLDQYRNRMDMPSTKEAVRTLSRRWPRAEVKLVEDKANGPAVIQELGHDLAGLIAVNPEGGKLARANAIAPQAESGNIYLPHPAIAPWVDAFIEEASTFPKGRHDDQVDAMTQALNRLRTASGGFSVPESQFTVDPFAIPEAWPQAFGMAITPGGVAALWGARDAGGTIYLYGEHFLPHLEPSQNAAAIRAFGNSIPGVLNSSSLRGSEDDKQAIVRLYRGLGLTIQKSTGGEDSGILKFLQLLAANKLKVFVSLSGFLAEYRMDNERTPFRLCCHALLLHLDRMRPKPIPAPELLTCSYGGEDSWMKF